MHANGLTITNNIILPLCSIVYSPSLTIQSHDFLKKTHRSNFPVMPLPVRKDFMVCVSVSHEILVRNLWSTDFEWTPWAGTSPNLARSIILIDGATHTTCPYEERYHPEKGKGFGIYISSI